MAKRYKIIGGARGLRPAEVTIDDIYKFKEDYEKRLTTSPFGLTPEQIEKGEKVLYPSKAVAWKGKKGHNFIRIAADRGALLPANELARKISKAYAGIKGTTVDPETGKVVPLKCVMQRNWRQDHPELARLYDEYVKPKIGTSKYTAEKGKLPFEVLPE